MNTAFRCLGFCGLMSLLSGSVAVLAQAPSRLQAQLSPEVSPTGIVSFSLNAPKAGQVVLAGQWPGGRTPMTHDGDGVWKVTVGPIPSGVWEYSFQVDGQGQIDPTNPAIKPMRQPRTSILHLPSDPPALHDFQDVPHGTVHAHVYRSGVLSRLRDVTVYTPPGYEGAVGTRYPVLYLQHGSGDNNATWVAHGHAHWILDNLIAQGEAVPMIVVMMDGHAAAGRVNTEMFERDLFEEVVPLVESVYRVNRAASHRAIAGLSMGGGQALSVGLNHLDKFHWVGAFSAAIPPVDSISKGLQAGAGDGGAKGRRLLWIACGKGDFLLQRNLSFIEVLKEKGVGHEWLLTEGDHSWPVWREYLGDFLPRLFRAE